MLMLWYGLLPVLSYLLGALDAYPTRIKIYYDELMILIQMFGGQP
jgi:hypothetical protein